MDTKALFKIGYGLYVLTTHSKGVDNGCIINTVQQVTDNPLRISIVVNKQNYTHRLIMESGVFNISVLTTQTPFSVLGSTQEMIPKNLQIKLVLNVLLTMYYICRKMLMLSCPAKLHK